MPSKTVVSKPKSNYQFVGEPYIWDDRGLGNMKVETSAVSLQKAKANICYKIKRDMGLVPSTPIRLYGRIREVASDGSEKTIRL